MAVCARGSVLVFYVVFAGGFQLCGEKRIYGSGHFSGSGADDYQLFFFIWPNIQIQ